MPLIGELRLDEITYTVIEDLKLALARKPVTRVAKEKRDEARVLSPKTVNNALMVLHRMLVTARKREESILSVPTSISAIDGGTLEAKGVKNLEELARSVPGLSVTPAGENEPKTFILRGIGPAFGTASTVAVYVNDAPITVGTNSPDLQLFDVERLEILRGPQGTLFGSSSMGGAIRYVTPKPSFDVTKGRVRLETSTTPPSSPRSPRSSGVWATLPPRTSSRWASGRVRPSSTPRILPSRSLCASA